CRPPELVEHEPEEMAREREEAARLLYVAATRARDLLVVSAVGEAPEEGWLAGLNPAVYPPPPRCREPQTRQPPGCPGFGLETIAVRPSGVQRPETAVTPGVHRPAAGRHTVVWWDPNVLG